MTKLIRAIILGALVGGAFAFGFGAGLTTKSERHCPERASFRTPAQPERAAS